jgi:hypothetical protein
LCRPVLNAFIRVGTNARLQQRPLRPPSAQSRFDQSCVRLVQPTDQHWTIFSTNAVLRNVVGNLVSNAHLAALAVEHNCVPQSSDADCSRFRGLKWKNLVAE